MAVKEFVEIINIFDRLVLKDIGIDLIATSVGAVGLHTSLVTEKAVRDAIKEGEGNGIKSEIISTVEVGGVKVGEVIPIGTLFEDLFNEILSPAILVSFSYAGYTEIIEIDTVINEPSFLWEKRGFPLNLKISDDDGQLSNQSVSGGEYEAVGTSYVRDFYDSVKWNLSGDNVETLEIITTWVRPSYIGKNSTGLVPNELDIKAGTKLLIETKGEVFLSLSTTDLEYGWFAVPTIQTGKIYTDWKVSEPNQGEIGPGEFIVKRAQIVMNETVSYDIYMYNYNSELSKVIKIS